MLLAIYQSRPAYSPHFTTFDYGLLHYLSSCKYCWTLCSQQTPLLPILQLKEDNCWSSWTWLRLGHYPEALLKRCPVVQMFGRLPPLVVRDQFSFVQGMIPTSEEFPLPCLPFPLTPVSECSLKPNSIKSNTALISREVALISPLQAKDTTASQATCSTDTAMFYAHYINRILLQRVEYILPIFMSHYYFLYGTECNQLLTQGVKYLMYSKF